MFGRVVAGTIASVALLCATIAWGGWVYLHTVGDPHRTEEIATAVLDNAAARQEISTALADQIVERTGLPANTTPTIASAVSATLGDPRISQNLIDAFGSEHARALGVDDPRPTTIDTAALIAAVRDHLAASAPSIVARLDTYTAQFAIGMTPPKITLPDLHTDAAGTFRSVAQKTTTTLGLLAVLLIVLAFAVGDRRHVLRRLGTWAIFSGIGWLAGPYLVALIAKQFASEFSATIDAVRQACQGPVVVGSIVLVAVGVVSLVGWMLPIWPDPAYDGHDPYRPARAWQPRAVARREQPPAGWVPAGAASAAPPAPPAAPTRTPGPVDTFVRSQEPSVWQTAAPAAAHQVPPAHTMPSSSTSSTSIWAAASDVPPGDGDPWAMYFGPDRR